MDEFKGKSVLVTGAAGFIAYHLAARLVREGAATVYACDNFVRGERDREYSELSAMPQVKAIEIDLADASQYGRLPDEVDYVFHLAAFNGTQNFYENPAGVVVNSTLPTIFLVQKYVLLEPARVGRFIYAGTSESYATTVQRFGWPLPTDETVPLSIDRVDNPRWSYAISKTHGEVTVATSCPAKKVPYTILRYHNVYGPRMGDKHVVPDFMMRMLAGKYELYGYEDTRSLLYIDDAVEATLRAATSSQTLNQVINIGSPEEITMLELGKRILKVAGIEAEIACHPAPNGSVKRRVPDIRKLVAATNYAPQWSLDEGLRKTLEYYSRKAAEAAAGSPQ